MNPNSTDDGEGPGYAITAANIAAAAAEVSAHVGRTLAGLYAERDRDLRAALTAWGRLDLIEHGFILEPSATNPFGFEFADGPGGEVTSTIDNRVIVADERLCGTEPPLDLAEFTENVAGTGPRIDPERVLMVFEGERFRIGLLDPVENRRIPPLDTIADRTAWAPDD